MTNTGEPILGVIFQVHHSSNVFAIPIRHVARIEPIEGKVISLPRFPNHGVYRVHGKNISTICLSWLLGFEKSTSCALSNQNLMIFPC